MRRPSRSIGAFSTAAIDLFASVLGAFLIITAILLPDYQRKDEGEPVETLAAQAGECEAQLPLLERLRQQVASLAASRAENAELRRQAAVSGGGNSASQTQAALAQCEALARQTFLIVAMQWKTERHDVDLHVIDPAGNEFFFSRTNANGRNFASTPAALSLDQINGPGAEMWQHPVATPGTYRIFYNLFATNSNRAPAVVSGYIFYRNGRVELPVKELDAGQTGRKVAVATITVGADGGVRIER